MFALQICTETDIFQKLSNHTQDIPKRVNLSKPQVLTFYEKKNRLIYVEKIKNRIAEYSSKLCPYKSHEYLILLFLFCI